MTEIDAPTEALRVIDATSLELHHIASSLPGTLTDVAGSMRSLKQYYTQTLEQLAEQANVNEGLQQDVAALREQLVAETQRITDDYEIKLATVQTQLDRVTKLFGEVKAEEQWAVERLSEALIIPATNLRDMVEKALGAIEQAKQMVRENL